MRPVSKDSCLIIGFKLAIVLALGTSVSATITLPGFFGNEMVLQRNTSVHIWGTGVVGESITVQFAGQNKLDTVDAQGHWEVYLDPMSASSTNRTLSVSGSTSPQVSKNNVLVGDLWISCGQSNMQYQLTTMRNYNGVNGVDPMYPFDSVYKQEAIDAIDDSGNHPTIRYGHVWVTGVDSGPVTNVNASWSRSSPGQTQNYSAAAYFFARDLKEHLGVPIGILNVVDIVPAESWVDAQSLLNVTELSQMEPLPGRRTSDLFNGSIAPLSPMTIKGVIFYQGEYNVGRAEQYQLLFPTLIDSWRNAFGNPSLPFLFVQIAPYEPGLDDSEFDPELDMPDQADAFRLQSDGESAWAELREAQFLTAKSVPNTAMVVTVDIGDATDIHPRNKRPVGERLALAARKVAYGESILFSGPVFETLSQGPSNNQLTVSFSETGTGLSLSEGTDVIGFEIAGADHQFFAADASIVGNTVILSNVNVATPLRMRYGWANFPVCNLVDSEGLPASPFRADLPTLFQLNCNTITWHDGSFEDSSWTLNGGAIYNNSKISDGLLSLEIPHTNYARNLFLSKSLHRFDWNANLLDPNRIRPGSILGYSVDLAGDASPTGTQKAYLSLGIDETQKGNAHLNGLVRVTLEDSAYVNRQIAMQVSYYFNTVTDNHGRGSGLGMHVANEQGSGLIYIDNFSDVTVCRPMLGISELSLIDLGHVAPGTASAFSSSRSIFNAQTASLTDDRNSVSSPTETVTKLYGTANITPAFRANFWHVMDTSPDHVGAVLIGADADKFNFISSNASIDKKSLYLASSGNGLKGGTSPESVNWSVQFLGGTEFRTYNATVRIVTQAGNMGVRSTGQVGEPTKGFWYVDIPIQAIVDDPEPYNTWIDLWFPGETDPLVISPTADPDADLITNLQEWAHGLPPNVPDSSGIALNGLELTTPGLPVVYLSSIATGVDFRAVFTRLIDYEHKGLIYTVEFSSNLNDWYPNSDTPTILDTQSNVDLVSVPYPFFLPDFTKAKYFRVKIETL